jgi:ribosomal-protein-alanine N-acetyltransferase
MSTAFSSQVRYRSMARSDLPAALAIEKRSFRQPWDREQFLEAMGGKSRTRAYVLESGGRLIGYSVLEMEGRNVHLLNLAIHPEHRRRGNASRILAEVELLCLGAAEPSPAAGERRERERPAIQERDEARREKEEAGVPLGEIYLEVEETNLPAQLLYKKMGYRATKVLRNYYPALHEDGYRMVRKVYATPLGAASV